MMQKEKDMREITARTPKMKIKISVRNLVEFILRSGDIDNRQTTGMQAEAMQRGSRLHRKLQKKAGPLYRAEVPLKLEFEEENYTILLEGRADGIIKPEKSCPEAFVSDSMEDGQKEIAGGITETGKTPAVESQACGVETGKTASVESAVTLDKIPSNEAEKTGKTTSDGRAAAIDKIPADKAETGKTTSDGRAAAIDKILADKAETGKTASVESAVTLDKIPSNEAEKTEKTTSVGSAAAIEEIEVQETETGKTAPDGSIFHIEEIMAKGTGSAELYDTPADEGIVAIDEIKGVFWDITQMTEPVAVHLAQAKCYAFIYALHNNCRQMGVRMTYANLDTEELRYFYIRYTFEELEEWFQALMKEYKKWAQFQYDWRMARQASIKELEFPFPYRKGQKELVSGVYRTILRKKNLFIQAPTGTGKTISTLYPAVKAVGEEIGEKIFYLTAKTITAAVAKETFDLFYRKGYRAKTIQITAKEKLCLQDEVICNPVACPYARGHYDRVNEAVYKLLHKTDLFTREVILKQAQIHRVCPFELCLDTASWADNIICDYNYVFDPKVYLKRFFGEGSRGEYLFLVDEAHNLVERGRDMYSAQLYKEDFLKVKKIVKKRSGKLVKELQKCNQILLDYKRDCEKLHPQFQYHENISGFVFALMRLAAVFEKFFQQNREFEDRDTALELYYQVRGFLDVSEGLDENYVIYSEQEADGRFKIRLYCVDPSRNLQQRLDKGRSTVFFSATLLPIQYYKSLLSTKEDNYAIYAETVFRPEQKLVLIGNDVTSRYACRSDAQYERMAEYIYRTGVQKKGNYIVFFPSYKMMEDVYEKFLDKNDPKMDHVLQKSGMKEADREGFLAEFAAQRERSLIAFCVMGGIFGEGIDLKEEQLIGVMIIGTGLPQVGNEREILKRFYDSRSGNGFDYAYRYPGMNKVLQAAGRVIRTVSDVGIIELLDERFLQWEYQALFPREWESCQVCNVDNVSEKLQEFWKQGKDCTSG